MNSQEVILIDHELRQRVAQLARMQGTSEADVVRQALDAYCATQAGQGPASRDESHDGETWYDRFERAGLIGCIKDGPGDMSTNPKYFEGFGRD